MADESHRPLELHHVYLLLATYTEQIGEITRLRLAQLGGPKSAANRNFLGPEIPEEGVRAVGIMIVVQKMQSPGFEPLRKGLHVCNSPMCTLSQNGYGDAILC